MSADGRDYFIEEYKTLKTRSQDLTNEFSDITKYTLGGDAAIYTWIFANKPSAALFALYIPVALSAAATILLFIMSVRIKALHNYLGVLESDLSKPCSTKPGWRAKGWEASRHERFFAGKWPGTIVVLMCFVTIVTFALTFVPRLLSSPDTCLPKGL